MPKLALLLAMLVSVALIRPGTCADLAGMIESLYMGAYAPVKQARIRRIDGSYHFIMIDQPAAFLGEVDSFLTGS